MNICFFFLCFFLHSIHLMYSMEDLFTTSDCILSRQDNPMPKRFTEGKNPLILLPDEIIASNTNMYRSYKTYVQILQFKDIQTNTENALMAAVAALDVEFARELLKANADPYFCCNEKYVCAKGLLLYYLQLTSETEEEQQKKDDMYNLFSLHDQQNKSFSAACAPTVPEEKKSAHQI